MFFNLSLRTHCMVVIAALGSHSALEIARGSRQEGIPNVIVCQKGREKSYSYYNRRELMGKQAGFIDEILVLPKFSDVAKKNVEKRLLGKKAVFVPNRSFSVYVGYDKIEKFKVPIFGNRLMLRIEERDEKPNQYDLLRKAGIRTPRIMEPGKIDSLCLVKVPEASRSYERGNFLVSSSEELERKSDEMIRKGIITKQGMNKAVIEEFVVGAYFNFNFFYSPLLGELELMGIDFRRQTNLDGFLHLPAEQQREAMRHVTLKTIEAGHVACTIRESLLEKVFEAGEKFVGASKKMFKPGIIGPFALQSVVTAGPPEEDIVVYDVSPRMPGSPGIEFTPYSRWGQMGMGRRIAMEIKEAKRNGRLKEITT
ncbi:MAG: DUF1297 domain-containing protein [Candidatus Aenigmarchaeota archaeon]|nr:DUF1297 domain-containing protein [Candidatus Aenigmarchaeota archaeon]